MGHYSSQFNKKSMHITARASGISSLFDQKICLDTPAEKKEGGRCQDIAEHFPALVLNADFRPLSYLPLSLWNWQNALKAVFLDRVTIISEYDFEVHSPSCSIKLPSVIALKEYVKQPEYPAFTRFNLFLRDHFTCQYCGKQEDLTFDHVIPRRSGGRTNWSNILAACMHCNLAKGGRSPDEARMHPIRPAYKPSRYELQEIGRAYPPNYLHESWRDFLYWDAELYKD